MPRFEHGKAGLNWCDTCGTLILGQRCDVCSSAGRRFEVSKPGDVRPAMGKSVNVIASLFQKHFGTSDFLKGKTIFLNKVAGEDRTDEIVFQGMVIGTMRYDLHTRDFALDLRLEGARLLQPIAAKGVVEVGHDTGHLKGKNLPGSAVKGHKGGFKAGDPLIVVAGSLICSAVAKVPSNEIGKAEKAIGVRDVGKGALEVSKKRSSWARFVNANESHLRALESKGISDIKSFIGNNKLPVTLSFSGGKDSLACYGLISRATNKFTMIFVNTGLEFPETVRFVEEFAKKNHERLLVADAGNAFWEQVGSFGPPAKDFRWCCKVCKLAPLAEIIERNYPEGTVTVEGNRAFESFARSTIGFVERNPFVPNQIALNPIREWRAVDVWGYIWWRNLDYNPLYEEDFERIGCYLCPSCLESEWSNTSRLHPDLHARWTGHLMDWSQKNGAADEFVKYGFWRWKVFPRKMVQLSQEMGLKLPEERSDRLDLKWVKGVSPCVTGGYSAEGVLSVPKRRDFSMVAEALKTVGAVKHSKEFEIALVKNKDGTLKVFGGGQIVATGPTPESAERIFEAGAKALLRAQLCTECGICVRNCKPRAITLDRGLLINDERCTRCGRCVDACVVAHYYDKLVTGGNPQIATKVRRS
ncbi:phosphoadenosine phosphosulfate reductase domain-containing protein [Methanomassiliicoccus luminyensis]|uniref:phosphoadenosine phosphosulfate reductase domain-containing protein n=1 Tax=Methanomassiliicoccus luminyensis TaxID=1080712 RepID=UPI0003825C23|nr:phosphoadenosine phosphosulfate reductase family protein [Methanomassiliicoccus luminyensis]